MHKKKKINKRGKKMANNYLSSSSIEYDAKHVCCAGALLFYEKHEMNAP